MRNESTCPSDSYGTTADDCFFCPGWDAHKIGWTIAGACAAATTLVTLFTTTMHATHYQHPTAQRQVIRVLMMPCVYAIVSFFSYRYYQSYEYYLLAETAYESITLSAFLMLLLELVVLGTKGKDIMEVMAEKDKRKLPFPLNFIRFRASKPKFLHILTFSVLQYVIFRPLESIVGIVCEYYNLLCPQTYSVHYAEVWLDAFDFVSISICLYGVITFYVLCKDELKGRRPLNKFLAIKLIVFFSFYQSFVFTVLQHYKVIKATAFWTADNVSDGLSALCTTIEMVIFSVYMGWAYSWTEYTDPKRNPNQRRTGWKTYFQAIWDTINLSDFVVEIAISLHFFYDYMRNVEGTHGRRTKLQQTFMPKQQEKLPMFEMDSPPMEPKQPSQQSEAVGAAYQRRPEMAEKGFPGPMSQRPSYAGEPAQWGASYSSAQPTQPGNGYQQSSPSRTDYLHPQAYPASNSQPNYGQYGSPPAQSSPTRAAFPAPHPYGSPDPPMSSRSNNSLAVPITSPSRRPPGSQPTAQTYPTQASSLSPPGFPSPHPTGATPAGSSQTVYTLGTGSARSGNSVYVTPAQTPGDMGSTEPRWDQPSYTHDPNSSGSQRKERPESGIGIPGNPKLF